MNTPAKMNKELDQTPIFEPFPEPRTLPEGWDLSALLPGSIFPSDVQIEDHSIN